MITIQDNKIYFTKEPGPNLEHNLVTNYMHEDKIVVAIWSANKIPKVDNKIAYMYYEGVNHFSKSEYLYFPVEGGAGMVLKPHIRNRFGLKDVRSLQLNSYLPIGIK